MPQLNQDDRDFYDAMWNEWGDMIYYSPAPRIRREKIISWMGKNDITSLLDVGCGNGEFLLQVHKAMPKIQLAGADISSAVIKTNSSKLPAIEFSTLDLNNETLSKKFDSVVCMEVVEHCADYKNAIKRLTQMTNQWLFITVPCGPLFEIDRRVGHTRHFTVTEIGSAIEEAGLKVRKLQKWGFPFFNLYKHAINLCPDKMCESFLSSKAYGPKEKIIASASYGAFKLSLPWGGYQLFAVASR
jgi:SAM-dependent methyltransferase